MMGRDFAWMPVWALLDYTTLKFNGPGKWLWLKTVYWELHNGQKIYYAEGQ